MKLTEYEGKELFKKYGITVPQGILISRADPIPDFTAPQTVLKAQVTTGERMKSGGVRIAATPSEYHAAIQELFAASIQGEAVKALLVEEYVPAQAEYYAAFHYSTDYRSPVLLVSRHGGTHLNTVAVSPVPMQEHLESTICERILKEHHFPAEDIPGVLAVLASLWNLFLSEDALLAEINPLFKKEDGTFLAGDAKVLLERKQESYLDLDGDIAILASGGGASLLNIDTLVREGGRPANYAEYSGNPPAVFVQELTQRVLSKPGLKGCWVIGGTANFTDILETMRGFVAGLAALAEKPTYPFVIRRDGPNQEEAFAFLAETALSNGYIFELQNSRVSMASSAREMVARAYGSSSLL